jgi:mono/diheme cytochrome c family protein
MLLVVIVGAWSAVTVAGAQSPSEPTAAAAGAELFRTRGCASCHAGDVGRFQANPRPLFALAAAMWNHFPRMAEQIRDANRGRPYLTSGELRSLVAYLYPGELRPGVDEASLVGQPGDPKRGEPLVASKGCLACHAISAPGRGSAASLDQLKGVDSPWSIVAQMWNHSFLMQLETRGQGVTWAPLSETEMADLVAYLQQLMRAR